MHASIYLHIHMHARIYTHTHIYIHTHIFFTYIHVNGIETYVANKDMHATRSLSLSLSLAVSAEGKIKGYLLQIFVPTVITLMTFIYIYFDREFSQLFDKKYSRWVALLVFVTLIKMSRTIEEILVFSQLNLPYCIIRILIRYFWIYHVKVQVFPVILQVTRALYNKK